MLPPPIRIIGIDPGLRTTGWGIIEAQGSRLSFVACGCVRSDDRLTIATRLRQLHEGLAEIIASHAPHEAAVEETLVSHLLKSNCLVTGQPDWASVQIHYAGPQIDQESLLRYLIGFREHNEFHEQCVERIFTDILRHCKPQQLAVYARYTRRGGLDINPWRANFSTGKPPNLRTARQ